MSQVQKSLQSVVSSPIPLVNVGAEPSYQREWPLGLQMLTIKRKLKKKKKIKSTGLLYFNILSWQHEKSTQEKKPNVPTFVKSFYGDIKHSGSLCIKSAGTIFFSAVLYTQELKNEVCKGLQRHYARNKFHKHLQPFQEASGRIKNVKVLKQQTCACLA